MVLLFSLLSACSLSLNRASIYWALSLVFSIFMSVRSLSGTRDLPAPDLARAVECPAPDPENSYSSEEFLLPLEVRDGGSCMPEGLLVAVGPKARFF